MPEQIDLEPGEYQERRPRGWRWRLSWGHPEDNKLPMALFFLCMGWLVYFLVNLPDGTSPGVIAGVATFAACAGGLLVLWLRD